MSVTIDIRDSGLGPATADGGEPDGSERHPAITFNTSAGPIELFRAEGDERAYQSLDQVLELARMCQERDWPAPVGLVISSKTYDYVARLLAVGFPNMRGG